MILTINDWNARFIQQARWTQKLRWYVYDKVNLDNVNNIIEIGCGTGAVLNDFKDIQDKNFFGLDISHKFLRTTHQYISDAILTQADAHFLPYKNDHFDVVLCHFLLLWVSDPNIVIQEMKRIMRNNGFILFLAEPDYGGRIDYPDELSVLGDAQISSLISQGADPYIGRHLGSLFHTCDISLIEMGILSAQWRFPYSRDNDEWKMLMHDLNYLSKQKAINELSMDDLNKLHKVHTKAVNEGTLILFIPTFYAWGQVKK